MESVARNHGFADGNKRTDLILLHTMLVRSRYQLVSAHPTESLGDAAERMLLGIVNRKMLFEEVVDWFKARIMPLD